MAKEEKKMLHRAFTVITREGEEPFWLEIGASFEHKDGKGLTIALQALPLDGRIVLRDVGSGPREKPDRRSREAEPDDHGGVSESPGRETTSSTARDTRNYKSGQRRR